MSRHVVRLDETCMETALFFGFVCVLWFCGAFLVSGGGFQIQSKRFTKTSNHLSSDLSSNRSHQIPRFSGQMPLEACLLAHWWGAGDVTCLRETGT